MDRRHIQDRDVLALRARVKTLLNLELSMEPEIVDVALSSGADQFCVVPEGRQEITTEGGLDAVAEEGRLRSVVPRLHAAGAEVSLFVDPDPEQLAAASDLGADYVELHTGAYANASRAERSRELARLRTACELGDELGLRVNAGHGLNYDNVGPVARLPAVCELNIGHAIVSHAVFVGVQAAVRGMLEQMECAATKH